MIVPPALVPGDRISVIAPSGPFDRALVLRGLGWLSERYDVRFGPSLFEREGYLAGSDARRLSELNLAIRDRDTRAVVATRGGYGLTRIVHAADLGALRDHPKWLVGFSDFTALHVEAQRFGVASLHADNVAGLGRGDAAARARWESALLAPGVARRSTGLSVLRGGKASGPVLGGNLTVLFSCAAAGRLRLPASSVLLLEDIGEAPYRIDRMLSSLMVSGALDSVAAVVLGTFSDCPPGRYGVPVEEVLAERLRALSVPVLSGLAVGHGAGNEPIHLGLVAHVDGTAGSVTFGGS